MSMGKGAAARFGTAMGSASVRTKMLGVSAVILVSAIVLGIAAVVGLTRVNQSAESMYADNLQQVKTLAAVRADVAATRLALTNYCLSVTDDAKKSQLARMDKAQASFEENVSAYRTRGGDAAERENARGHGCAHEHGRGYRHDYEHGHDGGGAHGRDRIHGCCAPA